jgi:uncharacterized protein YegL
MHTGRHSWTANTFDREAICATALRLVLAVFAAVIVLISLLHGLSRARCQNPSPIDFSLDVATDDTARCRIPTLDITKIVYPSNPEVGSVVTIGFIITGLNPKPVDVVLVQDVSGSMQGQRLEDSKDAAIAFVNMKQDEDRVAVVAYSSTVRLTRPLTASKLAITTTIEGLKASGRTNVGAGIEEGYRQVISPTSPTDFATDTVKAMILLSDGWANEPVAGNPKEHAREWARKARDCGILIFTVGFGENSNAVDWRLLRYIADTTDGKYYFAPNSTQLMAIYQEIAMELRNIVITDVLQPGVSLDCGLIPNGWGCFTGTGGLTTVTYTISNERPMDDPLILSFTATVSLTPEYERQVVNAPGSCVHYDGPGNPFDSPDSPPCQCFENRTVCMRPYLTDTYEPDGNWRKCKPIFPGEPQLHSFSHSGDVDWVGGEVRFGEIYAFTTTGVSADVGDRVLELCVISGMEPIPQVTGTNSLVWSFENSSSTSASEQDRASIICLSEPIYYCLGVSSLDDRFGCGTRYELSAERSPLPASITVTVHPSAHTAHQGQSAACILSVDATPGFEWPVVLTVDTLPGTTTTLSPNVLRRSQSATLAITTGLSTPTGTHALTVSGVGGSLSDTTTISLSILPADFTLAVTPPVHTAFRGQTFSFLVELASATPGFAFPVALDVGGAPSSTPFRMAPSEITSGTQATLFITTTDATPLGSHRLVVTGTVGKPEHSTQAAVQITVVGVFLPIILRH